jgi:cold shock protein
MTMLPNRIDMLAEINACEFIRAFDEPRLDLELRKIGLDPEGLPLRLEALLNTKLHNTTGTAEAYVSEPASTRKDIGHADTLSTGPVAQLAAAKAAASTCTPAQDTFEQAGTVKFFDAAKGYGFFTADGEQSDVLVHVSSLEAAGYRTAYEGARIHALVRKSAKGLQAVRIISIDESNAIHPSLLPQRTHQKVHAQSDWVKASVKWYDRLKGFGFVCEAPDAPDCFVHADTLRRWGLAALRPGQLVEIRYGMSPRGRMVAEIRHCEGLSALPPVH